MKATWPPRLAATLSATGRAGAAMTPSNGYLLLALASLAAMAGCLEGTEAEAEVPAIDPVVVGPPPLPQDFSETGAVPLSLYNPSAYCGGRHVCARFEFDVDAGWENETDKVGMQADLVWTLPGNELDLVLYEGTTEIDADYTLFTNSATLTAALGPGHYTLLVDAYAAVGADEFEITVAFERVDG
jgi:hypothetical protein